MQSSSAQLKAVQTRLHQAEAEFKLASEALEAQRERTNEIGRKVRLLSRNLKDLKELSQEPVVSEHALLRYIERVYDTDLSVLRREILSPDVLAAIQQYGNCTVNRDGYQIVVKDRVVITIQEDKPKKQKPPSQYNAAEEEE